MLLSTQGTPAASHVVDLGLSLQIQSFCVYMQKGFNLKLKFTANINVKLLGD